MFWITFSSLYAFFQATTDVFSKKVLKDNCDAYLVGWARWAFAVPFLLITLLFMPIPALDQTFWYNIFLLLPLGITALFLYIKALNLSPISLAIPFLSFTPVFLILTSHAGGCHYACRSNFSHKVRQSRGFTHDY